MLKGGKFYLDEKTKKYKIAYPENEYIPKVEKKQKGDEELSEIYSCNDTTIFEMSGLKENNKIDY